MIFGTSFHNNVLIIVFYNLQSKVKFTFNTKWKKWVLYDITKDMDCKL